MNEKIDIIGHLKINESNPDRVKYLISCIRSMRTIKGHCNFILNLENPSDKLYQLVKTELEWFDNDINNGMPNFAISKSQTGESYGKIYCGLLAKTDNKICLNFIEDHFLIIEHAHEFNAIISTMKAYKVDVLKTSFYDIEKNSSKTVAMIKNGNVAYNHSRDIIFVHNQNNHIEYSKFYKERFFIGVNFITTKKFAFDFWNRGYEPSKICRPHEYEFKNYNNDWTHTCMIPGREIFASIDDDHGEIDSCLLKRKNNKFWDIYNDIR